MADYHLNMGNPIQRSQGRSVVAAAAYRAGVSLRDERTGLTHDYTRKQGVTHSEIVLPEDAPQRGMEREAFWNGVEGRETRKNSQVGREIIASLPHELSEDTRREIALAFARHLTERHGLGVEVSLHEPNRQGDDRNFHAHFLMTTRRADPESATGWGEKARELDGISERQAGREGDQITHLREHFAGLCNRELERFDIRDERGALVQVDHRSFKTQGIDREPTIKEGVAASGIERRGEHSDRAAENDNIRERNAEREELTQQIAATERELTGLISDARRTPLYDQLQWRFRGVPEMAALFAADAAAERDQAQGRDGGTEPDAAPRAAAHRPDAARYHVARELNRWMETQVGEKDWDYSLDTGKDNEAWLRELVLQIPYENSDAPSSRLLWNVASMPDKAEPPSEDAAAWDEVKISHWLKQTLYHLPEEERSRPAGRFLQHVSDSLQERLEREGPRQIADSPEPSTLPEIDPFGPAARFLKAAAVMPDAEAQPEELRAGDAEPISATETIRRGLPDAERNRTARELNEWLNEPEPKEPNPLADQMESDPARRLLEKVADMPERTEADEAQKKAEERRKMHEEIWGPPSETESPAERFIQKQVFGGGFGIS